MTTVEGSLCLSCDACSCRLWTVSSCVSGKVDRTSARYCAPKNIKYHFFIEAFLFCSEYGTFLDRALNAMKVFALSSNSKNAE